jgi:hypothetical protein
MYVDAYGSRKLIIKKSGARAQNSMFESTLRTCVPHRFWVIFESTLRTCIPHRFWVIFESTLRTCDPHPSKTKLRTCLKHDKLHPILVRIGAGCVLFRGDSEYGTLVAIWEIMHNIKKTPTNNKPLKTQKTTKTVLIAFSIGISNIEYQYQ